MLTICFDDEDADGKDYIENFFTGTEFLADGETFEQRVDWSFCDEQLATDWLEKSYRGRDADGVGVLVNGQSLPDGSVR